MAGGCFGFFGKKEKKTDSRSALLAEGVKAGVGVNQQLGFQQGEYTIEGVPKRLDGSVQGSFGVVFRAKARDKKRRSHTVFLKKPGADEKADSFLLQEHNVLQHLARLPGYSDYLPQFYMGQLMPALLLMEYISHGDLLKYMEHNRISNKANAKIALQLAKAIKFLHQHHVVHRDIKPENVMIASKRPLRVKIVDYGLSVIEPANPKQEVRQICAHGTVMYIAPELLILANEWLYIDLRQSDVASLGYLFIHLFTGMRLTFDKVADMRGLRPYQKAKEDSKVPDQLHQLPNGCSLSTGTLRAMIYFTKEEAKRDLDAMYKKRASIESVISELETYNQKKGFRW